MESAGPVSNISTHKSSQRKFFQWAAKWFYNDEPEDITVKPDAPELACLLQAIGFQLREFEKHEENNGRDKTKNNSLRVTIECGTSQMRAVMEMDDVNCQCPNQDDAKDASFWSVSGTGPLGSMENMNKVVETGSNLLPSISKGVTNVVRDVVQHLLKLIKNIPDVNQNTDSNLNLAPIDGNSLKTPGDGETGVTTLTRRHTQPDFNAASRCRSLEVLTNEDNKTSTSSLPPSEIALPRNRSSSFTKPKTQRTPINEINLKQEMEAVELMRSSPVVSPSFPPPLRRQKTFDMDIETSIVEGEPRPSPPKISSSPVPVPQLCMSLGQISLQSDGKDVSLTEMLLKAKTNLELALKMLATSPHNSHFINEDPFLKPALPKSSSSSLRISPGTNSRPESSCSLPVNCASRNSSLQKSSVRRNVASSFRKSTDGVKSPADRKSTPTNKSLLQRRSFTGRLTVPKSLALKVDTPRPSGTSVGQSSGSAISRTILAVKRRVSPDPKSSPSNSQIQKSNASLLQKSSFGMQNKIQGNIPTPKSVPATGVSANKFGFLKKKTLDI